MSDREKPKPQPASRTRELHIDMETRSACDLRKHGPYVYAQHPTTDLWCICFAIDDGPVLTWLPGQPVPPQIVAHVAGGGPVRAHNSVFERLIWTHILAPRYGWPLPSYTAWGCTLARAYTMALPGSLDSASYAVGLDLAKDSEGYRLMLMMARPRRIVDGKPVWQDDLSKLNRLVNYCKQDVIVERALHERLVHLSAQEHKIWQLDQRINDRGLMVDRQLCVIAKGMIEEALDRLNVEIKSASNGEVATTSSVLQIVRYCAKHGLKSVDTKGKERDLDSIAADELERLLARDLPPNVRRVLEIRKEASKVSVKKIQALLTDTSEDGRVRGLLAYHAASTGRWAGRRFQPQNIRRPQNKHQDILVKLVRERQMDAINLLGGPLAVISDIIRGMIIAAPGNALYAADFSNIEGRGLAWLVGEEWKLEAYRAYDRKEGPDLYKLAYSRAFYKPIVEITDHDRQIGKVMELALGYQGGVGAFQTMAAGYGVQVTDERAEQLKRGWRDVHPCTVKFWTNVEMAAIRAVQHPELIVTCGRLKFRMRGSFLLMRLPSGRCLSYPYPKIMSLPLPWSTKENPAVKPMLTYKSQLNPSNARRVVKEEKGNTKVWGRISAYGGLLTENAVQAIARDVMAEAMLRLDTAGFPLVLTVHDEVVAEAPAGRDLAKFNQIVEAVPGWAAGFPIVAKAWTGNRYRKD